MRGVFGETVRVFSPGLDTATDPFSGESVPSWTWPDTVEYTGVPVEPETGWDPSPGRPAHQSERLLLSLPYDAVVSTENRVEIVTGTYAGMWTVDGPPERWKNPFTGWAASCDVRLVRTEG